MTKSKKVTLLRITAAIVTVASLYLFSPWEFGLYYLKPLPHTIDQELANAVDARLDGIIVYVDQKGKAPELYADGFHNKKDNIKAYPDALFKIASIAKLYDASAVTKLVSSGQLSLDKTLAYYMPELITRIQYAEEITLRMMIQHRSGIPNFTDDKDFRWDKNNIDVLGLILDDPADFAPDTDYGYSNTNYYLIQKIMTRVLGYNYGRFIKEGMLSPLGISSTYMSINEVELTDVMSGYFIGSPDDFKHLDQGMVATAPDVGVFLRALNDGSLFSTEEMQIYQSLYKFEHDGWVLGYWSRARYIEDIDTVVVQFVNTTGDDTLILSQIVFNRVVDILREKR